MVVKVTSSPFGGQTRTRALLALRLLGDTYPRELSRLLEMPLSGVRDRLAAFYHWNDRQSLGVAVSIARRNRVDLAQVRRWSAREGFADGFAEFLTELARRRRAGTRSARGL